MDPAPPPPPSQPPQPLPLVLPPPPTLVPVRPNLGTWTQHDHHRLRHALGRIPSWDIATLAAAILKPPVEVVWHLSTVHTATLAVQQAPEVALDPLQALLVGFKPVKSGGEQEKNGSDRHDDDDDDDDQEESANEWESDDASDNEDHEHEQQHPSLYAQESDKPTITKEEDASTRLGRNLDKLLVQLNQERPLSRPNKCKLNVFYRSRITKIMSHHHNNATPLTVLNDTWLDLHTHLTTFIRTRVAAAYNLAYTRLQSTHKHGTHIVVDQLSLDDMHSALAQCAATSMRNGAARARADRDRTADLVHWWHAEYLPANPGVPEEMGKKIERMFRERGIEWRAVRTWKPNEDMLARLDHVFVKARRARKRGRGRVPRAANGTSGSESSGEGSSGDSSASDDERGAGARVAEFERARRWLDAAAAAEPVKLPNPQGLFHVDALVSIQDDQHDEEEEDELDASSTDRNYEDRHGASDDDEPELDSDGLPRSGQRPSTRSTPPPRSPPPAPHAPFQTPARLRSLHASQFATPAAPTPGTTRRRPIRYRVGLEAGDEPMDVDGEPPSLLRSSRRAKRPLPPDESPSRSRVRAGRWEDAGAASDDEEEGQDQEDDEEEDGGGAASRSSDGDGGDMQAASGSGSWNARSVKRARFA